MNDNIVIFWNNEIKIISFRNLIMLVLLACLHPFCCCYAHIWHVKLKFFKLVIGQFIKLFISSEISLFTRHVVLEPSSMLSVYPC